MLHRRIRKRHASGDLDMTSFMNLMVVLVPFLLATAVFSRMSILDMNLPGGGESAGENTPPPLVLEITIRPDQIEVGDRNSGLMKELPQIKGVHDYTGLNEYLKQVKERFPDITEATILAEEKTPYDDIVQTMDSVRVQQVQQNKEWVQIELFPEISLGGAVPDPRANMPAAGGAP